MLKSFLIIILLSVAAIFFQNQLVAGLHGLMYLHTQLAHWLALIFSQDPAGRLMQATIGLIVVPLLIGIAVAIILIVAKRDYLKYSIVSIWAGWTVLLVGLLAQH